jgi:hypothetical protein
MVEDEGDMHVLDWSDDEEHNERRVGRACRRADRREPDEPLLWSPPSPRARRRHFLDEDEERKELECEGRDEAWGPELSTALRSERHVAHLGGERFVEGARMMQSAMADRERVTARRAYRQAHQPVAPDAYESLPSSEEEEESDDERRLYDASDRAWMRARHQMQS